MAKRISENDLFLPALYVIYQREKTNTSQITKDLTAVFNPTGEDSAILAGRKDTKFSQKVRNLMGSHYETNGMSFHTEKDSLGFFTLTEQGKKAVEDNAENLSCVFSNSFKYEDLKAFSSDLYSVQQKKNKLYVYDETDTVSEGKAQLKTTKARERSQKLRNAAIQHYTVDGKISCCVCGFDFFEKYGDHGKEYIQIHHEKPLYQCSDEGADAYIAEAVKNTKPVCPNCHCMIHRDKAHMLTIEELKALISKTSRC